MSKTPAVVEPVQPSVDPTLQARLDQLAKEKAAKEKIMTEDAAKIAAAKAKADAAEQAVLAKQKADRDKILASPLTPEEMADYQNLVSIANSGRYQLTSVSGRKLADYRIRLKNNGEKNPK